MSSHKVREQLLLTRLEKLRTGYPESDSDSETPSTSSDILNWKY